MTSQPSLSIGSQDSDLMLRDIVTIASVSLGSLFTYSLNQPVLVTYKSTGETYVMYKAAVGLYSRFADNHGDRRWLFYWPSTSRICRGFCDSTRTRFRGTQMKNHEIDPYTRVPRSIKKKWKARERNMLIVGWIVLMIASIYLIGIIAEQFEGRVDWP